MHPALIKEYASRFSIVCAAALALAACSPEGTGGSPEGSAVPNLAANPAGAVQSEPLSGSANVLGNGPVKVALILPLTQNGAPNPIGTALRNSAQIALDEAHNKDITLIVEDDQATPSGATAAAQDAVNQQASLVLGPLFASSVHAASAVTRPAHIPMIAFSTDASVASNQVYLLSFLVESYVDRIMSYAVAHGRHSFAALIPNTDYGRAAEAEFLQDAAKLGVSLRSEERYDKGQYAGAVRKLASVASSIDAVFIPEQAGAMSAIGPELASAGITPKKTAILGTGLWDDPRVLTLPSLQGALFASPDNTGFGAFSKKYQAKFGSAPPRIATLAHDAVALAVALARMDGASGYSADNLTAASGFRGVDGLFRFLPNGLNQRGLAVDQIKHDSAVVVSPAPRTFDKKTQG